MSVLPEGESRRERPGRDAGLWRRAGDIDGGVGYVIGGLSIERAYGGFYRLCFCLAGGLTNLLKRFP